MKFSFVAHSLTKPTRDTLEEISQKSFKKIQRLLERNKNLSQEAEIRVSAERNGDEFVINAEAITYKEGVHVAKTKNRDLRRAINEAAEELKTVLTKIKDKRVRRKKGQFSLKEYSPEIELIENS